MNADTQVNTINDTGSAIFPAFIIVGLGEWAVFTEFQYYWAFQFEAARP